MYKKVFNNKIYLTCFADGKIYEDTQTKFKETYKGAGIDEIIFWNKKQIQSTEFYEKNKKILDIKKGAGLWIWKPYIILDLMNKIDNDDFIIYCDCSSQYPLGFEYNVIPLLNYLHKNKLFHPGTHLFTNKYILKYWSHNETFKIMNLDREKYGNKNMCQTSPSIWRKNDLCKKFLNEWLHYCSNYNCIKYIDNMKNIKDESFLIRSQCDQSILSLLIHKYKLKVFSPRGPFPNNIVTDEKKKDKKNGIYVYVRFLKNHNYIFKLACENKELNFIQL